MISPRHIRLAMGGLRHLVLAVGACVVLFPFIWMLSASFKPPPEIYTADVQLIPIAWTLENYVRAFSAQPLGKYLLNGVIVTLGILAFQLLFTLPCAYALAKLKFRGRETLFTLIILGLLIPEYVIAIPVFFMVFKAGLLNTYWSLIVPFWISAFGIFLMRQFFKTIPDELLDAARLDGCSEFMIVWRIMAPLALPAVMAFAIFSVVFHWNDYYWPLIMVNEAEIATPPLGIVFFRNAEAFDDVGAMMAAAVIITVPLIFLFLSMQRRFIEGITIGSFK
jgi:multiple sugar transport system permease protein